MLMGKDTTRMRRCLSFKVQFRLISLLVAAGLIAVVFLGVQHWLEHRPIQWLSYTQETVQHHADDDRPVVLFIGADWDANSIVVKTVAFADSNLKREFRRRSVAAYFVDPTHATPESVALMKQLGSNSTPTVAVFPHGTDDEPIVLFGIVTAEQVKSALTASKIGD